MEYAIAGKTGVDLLKLSTGAWLALLKCFCDRAFGLLAPPPS